MTYTIILDEGVVIRDSDGQQIAPCQSVDDLDFIAYNAWVADGGEPTVLDTRS
jgi:hypothetical protein